MRIRWTPAAAADLQSISEYLKEHHPSYRDPTILKLYGVIRELKQWPERGRPGADLSRCTGPFLKVPRYLHTQSN